MVLVVGCNFRTAPLALRERLAFEESEAMRALNELRVRFGCEAVVLSTCNRVELYLASASPLDEDRLAEFLAEFHQVPLSELKPCLYRHAQADAVRHLFRVICGLDSMIVGEVEIAGQVRRAYEVARRCGTVGPTSSFLFQHARRVAARVRKETGLGQGRVSVASAAIDYVRKFIGHLSDKTVLIIGAGKISEMMLRRLCELRPKRILTANRSLAKAEEMARNCNGWAIPWEQLDEALVKADIVLSATGAPQPIISRERYEIICARRSARPMLVLDIAVPRDFDPSIQADGCIRLLNIDDLKRPGRQAILERLDHMPRAMDIVAEEQGRFLDELAKRRQDSTYSAFSLRVTID